MCACNGGIGACGIENKQFLFSPIECIHIHCRCDDNYEYTLRVNIYEIVIHFQEIHPLHIVNEYTRDLTLYNLNNSK
jgi:hypothetical protein